MKVWRSLFFIALICVCYFVSVAQCTLTISTFPYNESFEAGQGGWISGGTGDDWAWGIPSKPIISSAGTGSKCWITGGLTTSFYNNGERSWVESPCFDFTTLAHPYISFKVFWETERQYDGGTFQYSLNGGTTWTNVGSNTDPVSCVSANWFNYASITNLASLASVRQGWSGTTLTTSGSCQGGFGSGGWVVAKHCMQYLAGEPSVKFRFAFGAGTTCNNYDGLAFDDVTISEAPAVIPAFTFSCLGTNALSFTDQSATCPNSWSWNFNDPSSGSSNVATTQNASHTFSSPGSYNVTLSAENECSATASVSHTINIINATATPANVSCFGGNNGSATIAVSGNGSPFTYHWNTNPVQAGITATGLPQGSYQFIVNGNNVCPDTNTVTINQPAAINHSIATTPAHCGSNNGVATETVSGGTVPYSYSWTSGSGNVSSVNNLGPGNYSVTVTDSAGCAVNDNFTISQSSLLSVALNSSDATCGLNNGSVAVLPNGGTSPFAFSWSPNVSSTNAANNLSGGNYVVTTTDAMGCVEIDTATIIQQPGITMSAFSLPDTCSRNIGSTTVNVFSGVVPYSYLWNPGSFNSPSITNLAGGSYTVTVTDANGCSKSQTVSVANFGNFILDLGDDATICTGNTMTLVAGNFQSYRWQDSSQLSELVINKPGIYWVSVTNNLGCTDTDTIVVKEECLDDVVAPNAFSPNGDGKNDFFFASGLNVTSFNMQVYNRWGETIFESDDINVSWNGFYNGRAQESDIYVWVMNFSINSNEFQRKVGHVMLIR